MPAHKIVAPFKDQRVLSVIKKLKKNGAQKAHIKKALKQEGFRNLPERSVDRALLRLKESGLIVSKMRRWFPKA